MSLGWGPIAAFFAQGVPSPALVDDLARQLRYGNFSSMQAQAEAAGFIAPASR